MKLDTCSADDVVEVAEAVLDGGDRLEIVLTIDTGDLQISTRLTPEQARAMAAALVQCATPSPPVASLARCPHSIPGATEGKVFQCERDSGHRDRCCAGRVYWQE